MERKNKSSQQESLLRIQCSNAAIKNVKITRKKTTISHNFFYIYVYYKSGTKHRQLIATINEMIKNNTK